MAGKRFLSPLLVVFCGACAVYGLLDSVPELRQPHRRVRDYLSDKVFQLLGTGCIAVNRTLIVETGFEGCGNAARATELFSMPDNTTCEIGSAEDQNCDPVNSRNVYFRRPIQYDKTLAPPEQAEIIVSATVLKVNTVSIATQTYSFSVYLRHQWVDRRLRWGEAEFGLTSELYAKDFDGIWMPDSFLPWATKVESDDTEQFVEVFKNGTVVLSQKMYVTALCEMQFVYYPFEVLTCRNDVESYAYDLSQVKYVKPAKPYRYDAVIIDNQCDCNSVQKAGAYHITGVSALEISKKYGGRTFTGVRWVFKFEREWLSYMWTSFLTLWLITLLSIASCWIDNQDAGTRLALGITTLLVLITELASFRDDIPSVTYMTAMDFYFLATFAVVVLNVIEYAFLHQMNMSLKEQQKVAEARSKASLARHENAHRSGCNSSRANLSPSGSATMILSTHEPIADQNDAEAPDSWNMRAAALTAFRAFEPSDEKGGISQDTLLPCLLYLGVLKDRAVTEEKKLKRQTGGKPITEEEFVNFVLKEGLLEQYGNALAASWRNITVTRSRIADWDRRWRRFILIAYIFGNILWFTIVGVMSRE